MIICHKESDLYFDIIGPTEDQIKIIEEKLNSYDECEAGQFHMSVMNNPEGYEKNGDMEEDDYYSNIEEEEMMRDDIKIFGATIIAVLKDQSLSDHLDAIIKLADEVGYICDPEHFYSLNLIKLHTKMAKMK